MLMPVCAHILIVQCGTEGLVRAFRALAFMLLCRSQMSLVNSVVGSGAAAPSPSADLCAGGADDGCTDLGFAQKLRIGAVFIILASSTLGVWLPVIAGEPWPYRGTRPSS